MIFAMSMTCFPLKRLIAALLPISFMWLFVACVSMCARESTERLVNNQVSSPIEIRDASDCKGCPLTSFPKARIRERTIHGSDLKTPVVLPSLIFSVNVLGAGVAVVSRQRQGSSTDPPLERLPALRI
jgi:hypothetical protein